MYVFAGEIYGNLILYNFGIFLANEAALEKQKQQLEIEQQHQSQNKYHYQVDFSSALRIARKYFWRDSRTEKDIIHLILCLQELINNDPEVSPYLKVVMIENYNVTKAEKLIPACDISEQISLASKEASGTGNMKFMLNGALTLGTEDGANVEIHELVGDDNIFVFGASSEEVIKHYENADYVSRDFYEKDETIKEAVDFITSKELLAIGHEENLTRLQNELLNKDWFMTLLDFKAYTKKKEEALEAYEDRKTWAKKMIVNIAKAGYFSSDRTIAEYNNDIWHA